IGSCPRSVGSPTYALQKRRVWFHSLTTRYARSAQSGGTVECGRARITRISSSGPSSVNSTACRSHIASRLPLPSARNRMSSRSSALPIRPSVTGAIRSGSSIVDMSAGTTGCSGWRWAGTPARTLLCTATSPPGSGSLPPDDPGRHDHHGIVAHLTPQQAGRRTLRWTRGQTVPVPVVEVIPLTGGHDQTAEMPSPEQVSRYGHNGQFFDLL